MGDSTSVNHRTLLDGYLLFYWKEKEEEESASPLISSRPSILMEFIFLVFLSLLLFLRPALGQQQKRLTSTGDLVGLYSLRSSLGLRARDWPRKTDPCVAWTGVQCRDGRVVGLNLSELRRTRLGKLSPAFAADGLQNLTRLEFFNSTGFALPGPIPDWFGSLLPASFSVLDLRSSEVSGSIPYSIGNLVGLTVLSLSGNSLAGSIPPTIGELRSLSVLDLSKNGLTGEVPVAIGSMGNLSILDLKLNFLSGSVPSALGSLRKLKTLELGNNSFSGSVPGILGELAFLVSLDLSFNSLSGSLPVDLGNLRSLEMMDLGSNTFTGVLSEGLFSGLSRLQSITLSKNNFTGSLPDSLWALRELRFVDVSYNDFTGTFPDTAVNASGAVFNISHNSYYGPLPPGILEILQRLGFLDISGNYFEGQLPFNMNASASVDLNCFRDVLGQRSLAECTKFYTDRGMIYEGAISPRTNPTIPSGSSNRKRRRRLIYILVGIFGGLLFLTLLCLLLFVLLRKRRRGTTQRREGTSNIDPSRGALPSPRIPVNISAVGDSFTYAQLLQATSNFSDTNLIKHGHSGDLFHGVLESGGLVVVKRVDTVIIKGERYLMELDFFARASHTRLIPLLGHCLENENEKLLVYKYMPNGDLSSAFYRKSGQPGEEGDGLQSLDWITRSKIAIGVAEALCYLHHECAPPLVHRDIQASSILLDDKFEVRLGSLSEVCTQEGDGRQNVVTRFLRLSQSSEPSRSGSSPATCAYDVYCFGKVLLELVTGKLGISGSNDERTNEWLEQTMPYINIYERDLLTTILDPSLVVDEDLMEEVWAMAIVAKSCLNSKSTRRPPVKYILKALENPLKVVRDENISNSARLKATSSRGSWNANIFGSRRSSSDVATASAPPKEMSASLKRSGTAGSQGSPGEQSFNRRRPSKDIFPEPSNPSNDTED